MSRIIMLFFIGICFNFTLAATDTDTTSIKKHLHNIINTDKPRNYQNIEALNHVAEYIHTEFAQHSDSVSYQTFRIKDVEYKNVICEFGDKSKPTIVIGAHYDVCGDQDGADDNASGVVGLLELAKMLEGKELNYHIELVAYTLEEPPYFRSVGMGSHVHAQQLSKENRDVYGMISLEMIGYYDDRKNSQSYPLGILSLIYGNRGDYITLVGKMSKGSFARKFNRKFKKQKLIKTKKFSAPASLEGVDFSDHLNYWKFGYSALMITDTAFFRNHNYHEKTDTIDTLDLEKMSFVIRSVYHTIVELK